MTTIRRSAAVGDPTMPQAIPDLGLTLTHLWLPKRVSGTAWADQVGTLSLVATAGTSGSVVAPTLAYEGLVPYLDFNGQSYMNDAGATLPAADLRTVIIVAKPSTGDTESASSNGGIIADTTVAMRQGVASTSVGTTPATTPTSLTAALDKWHMYALSLPSGGAGTVAVDGTSSALASQADLTRVRLLRSSTGAARKMKVAFVATASNTATASDLTTVVYPRLKAWLSPLAWV